MKNISSIDGGLVGCSTQAEPVADVFDALINPSSRALVKRAQNARRRQLSAVNTPTVVMFPSLPFLPNSTVPALACEVSS